MITLFKDMGKWIHGFEEWNAVGYRDVTTPAVFSGSWADNTVLYRQRPRNTEAES